MNGSRDLRRLLTAALGVAAISASGAVLAACRKDAPRTADEADASAGPSGSTAARADGVASSEGAGDDGAGNAEEGVDGAGQAARGVEARAEESRRDAGAIDAACEGASISLLRAAVDPRCEVTEREWSELVRTFEGSQGAVRGVGSGSKGKSGTAASPRRAASASLRQEARREGDEIVVSIVNRGSTPLVVPLRFHPGRPELAFSVLAESAGRGVFELAPPKSDAPEHAGGSAAKAIPGNARHPARPFTLAELDGGSSFTRVHSARIRLAPGGTARARLVIDPRIVKRLDRTCPDAGAAPAAAAGEGTGTECQPARLPKGHVVLYVGQLVTGIDAGEPARVEWDSP